MAKKESFLDVLWYIVYVIVNIFTLGSFWFIRGLITHSVKKAN